MPLFRRRKTHKVPPTEVSDALTHGHLGADMIDAGDELVEAADEAIDSFGAAAEAREQEEIAAGTERREQLEAEHGAEYHGFGHPPDDD